MSETAAGIVGLLTILGTILAGLICLALPIVIIAVVVLLVVKNNKAKAAPVQQPEGTDKQQL